MIPKKSLLMLAALRFLTFNDADAQLSARIDASSNYMFRGHEFTDCAVVQPTIRYSKGMDITLFSNYNTKNKRFDELDININNTDKVADIELSEGFTHVYEPSAKGLEYINEFCISADYPAEFTPRLNFIKPFGTIGGLVSEASLSTAQKILGQDMNISVLLGYESEYLSSLQNPGSKGLSHLEFRTGTDITVSGFTISPSISYSRGFQMPSLLYCGIGISKTLE